MTTKSTIITLTIGLLAITGLNAQTIPEGISHLYANRLKSARQTFEKMVATNPNNLEAVYWLGQAEIESNDVAAADALYSKTLQANGNAPLIMVGKGHVNLINGKKDEAKQMFETAINLSNNAKKGADPVILNAIGRANVDAKEGNIVYAIEKLNQASEKDPKNGDIFLNLGDAYRKIHEGGQAVQNYDRAFSANPAANPTMLARAVYRKGMIFYTQHNWPVYEPLMLQAISLDPKFAPAYYELYYYNLLKTPPDFTTAQDFANKYIANADPDPQNDYLRIQTMWAQAQVLFNKYKSSNGSDRQSDSAKATSQFKDVISAAKNLVTTVGEQHTDPHTYRLLALSSLSVLDTVAAKEYIDKFFAKAKDEDIVSNDYFVEGKIYASSINNPDAAMVAYTKGTDMDSVYSSKINNLIDEIQYFSKLPGKRCVEGGLRLLLYKNRKNPDHNDLFRPALNFYQCGNLTKADSLFTAYVTLYPDSIHGYYWRARLRSNIDSTMTQGLAVPDFEKTLTIAETDKVRFKAQGVLAAGNLAGYYYNIKRDKAAALTYITRGLAFDPTNPDLLNIQQQLNKQPQPKTQPPKTQPPKTKQTATKTPVKKGSKSVVKQ